MVHMSGNDECPSGNFGYSLQLTNWILDSGATCYMTPEVQDFIPGQLEDMDKHIEVSDGYHVTAKQKGQLRIKMCDNNGDPFIATSQNEILAPDLCDGFFSVITLINLGYTCLFHKGFCTAYLRLKEKMRLHYHIVHKGNMDFGENEGNVNNKKITIQKENCFRIVTSKIRSQIHHIIVGRGYC